MDSLSGEWKNYIKIKHQSRPKPKSINDVNSYDIYEKLNGSSDSCKYCLNWAEDDCKMKQVRIVNSN